MGTFPKMKKAVFLDKDGTLVPDIPYNVIPELITLQEGAVDGLKKLAADGYQFVIISNQSGVAKGYFAEPDIIPVRKKLESLLSSYHIHLAGFYYCPHDP